MLGQLIAAQLFLLGAGDKNTLSGLSTDPLRLTSLDTIETTQANGQFLADVLTATYSFNTTPPLSKFPRPAVDAIQVYFNADMDVLFDVTSDPVGSQTKGSRQCFCRRYAHPGDHCFGD